ncbi:hypothetical protein BDY21DRAFT_350017 [Lineolata rhizophorae]|uniref:Uncharacterized protein n=1 Tax=Lineolata rhizophorae TaxID=578093 RepID=A0A6A6NW31_9PEZI|nr:hypothetical protein BDY21DRAFT_350017 [Lineolata rhizophorae]
MADVREALGPVASSSTGGGGGGGDAKKLARWDWIYVDGDDVQAFRNALFGSAAGAGARKKAGGGTATGGDGAQLLAGGDRTVPKIVGREYIVQSLILGALVDEW